MWEKCNYKFTWVSNYQAHSRKCKVKLKKQMGPEDCINLMRPWDVNFCDIKAFEKMFKKLLGKNAVQSKMRDVLSNAVKGQRLWKVFLCQDSHSWEEKKDGTIEKFKTGVSFSSNQLWSKNKWNVETFPYIFTFHLIVYYKIFISWVFQKHIVFQMFVGQNFGGLRAWILYLIFSTISYC